MELRKLKTVLLLSTYPFTRPRHGGQVRIANIAKTYADADWKVCSIAVYEPEGYSSDVTAKHDIEFPRESNFRQYKGRGVPLINDLLTGHFAASKEGGLDQILNRLPAEIDVIHVEQPWLWPVVEKLKALPAYQHACTIYGSQNIEAPLKREILESYEIKDAEDVLADIEALERKAALTADISLAVTQSDFDTLQAWGAKRVMLAANGIAPWTPKEEKLTEWKEKLPKAPWILYVASAHPPNFTGFDECLGGSLACIPPDSRLVVAGSVGEHLARALSQGRWNSLNMSRLQLLYILADEDLAAVKALAHAYLLPIPHGGGSNIKTAEALYSGKYVIGTEAAFRGFEQHISLPEVSVSRTPSEFHSAIRRVLVSEETGSAMGSSTRESLTWAHCLSDIPTVAAEIALENKSK